MRDSSLEPDPARTPLGGRNTHVESAFSHPALRARASVSLDFRPGDVLGFSGRSLLDLAIQAATWSLPGLGLSHVALVAEHPDTRLPLLWESTSLAAEPCEVQRVRICGVQAHSACCRVRHYPGRVWCYRAVVPLSESESHLLACVCYGQLGRPYDWSGAINARETCLGAMLRRWLPEDHSTLYCSEFVAFVLRQVKRWSGPSAVCPNRLCRALVRSGQYQKAARLK